MITKEQAYNIAKQFVPDLDLRGFRISADLSNNHKLKKLPPGCWYVSYLPVPINYTACSTTSTIFMCIDKESGKILYHNSI